MLTKNPLCALEWNCITAGLIPLFAALLYIRKQFAPSVSNMFFFNDRKAIVQWLDYGGVYQDLNSHAENDFKPAKQ